MKERTIYIMLIISGIIMIMLSFMMFSSMFEGLVEHPKVAAFIMTTFVSGCGVFSILTD